MKITFTNNPYHLASKIHESAFNSGVRRNVFMEIRNIQKFNHAHFRCIVR